MGKLVKGHNEKMQTIFAALTAVIGFLIVWELVARFTSAKMFLPPASVIIQAFLTSFVVPIGKYTMQVHIAISLYRVLVAFLIATVAGVFLGVFMGYSKTFEAIFKPLFEFVRPIPPLAWIPMSILWFGIGDESKWFIIFPRVVLPSAVPYIFAGLQIAITAGWSAVVAAEMIRSDEGVGWLIVMGMSTGNTIQIMVGIVAIGAIGFILATLMSALERRLCRWNRQQGL